MVLPEDHLAKFHKMTDAKEMWEAIKSRIGSNDESKKMQKYLLKQQFEGFSVSTSEGLHKGYDRTTPGLDTLSFDDLYNNLRINDDDMEEIDLKWQVAMISMRTKKFHKRTGRKLHFDTKDPVGFDKTKVECFNRHKIRHFARDYRAKGNQDSRRRDAGYNGNKARDNGRKPAYHDDSKALVTNDGEDIDWCGHVEEDAQIYAKMAYSSSNSGFDNESVFINKESDLENTSVNDRYADRMHAVSPPMTGNYMPSGPDVEIDYSKFTYGPKQTLADESDSKPSEYACCESDSSVETTTSMPELVEITPKVVCKPKVWIDAPIIEEYESHSDDDLVCNVQEDKEKPSFAFTDSVKHVKPSREKVKATSKPNQSPKVEKQIEMVTLERVWVMLLLEKHALFVDDPHRALKDKGIVDSGCSRHMTGNIAHLADY
uniref:Ribonuclease H-like domain-containing protein n=1 Tax=Tanacetum cinerariifolium TaxID=118510 RepID=A0A6L2K5R7_TANCI|nr:ribonuclease H-like domain-containing protein [Tanacetum cinerariifolium]